MQVSIALENLWRHSYFKEEASKKDLEFLVLLEKLAVALAGALDSCGVGRARQSVRNAPLEAGSLQRHCWPAIVALRTATPAFLRLKGQEGESCGIIGLEENGMSGWSQSLGGALI